MSFNLSLNIHGDKNLKRESDNVDPCNKRIRTKIGEKDEEIVLGLIGLTEPSLLQKINSCVKFEVINNRPKSCAIKAESDEVKRIHVITSHPFEGLVIEGYECKKHNVRTLHLTNFKDHIRIQDKYQEKIIPNECIKKIIYLVNSWWVCPNDTPLTSRQSILNTYGQIHSMQKIAGAEEE